jgi:hypothetical protein
MTNKKREQPIRKESIMRSFRYMVFLLTLTVSSNLTAQEPGDELDPLMGSYILGNSAEIIMQCAPTSGDQGWRIFDYSRYPAEIKQKFKEVNTDSLLEISGGEAMDITSGDLNGDMYNNIIAAWECANHSIAICIPEILKDNLSWTSSHISVIDSVLNKRIRLFTGDFDRDRQKEFVLAYHGLDGYVHIALYQTDTLLVLEKLAEIADFALGTSTLFDLTAGDFDYDGLDEIVLIQYIASDYIGNDHYRLRSNVKVYDYDAQGQIFIPHTTNEISVINDYDASLTVASHVPRLVIAAGNLDGDAQEEVVYGYEIDFTYFKFVPFPQEARTHFYSRVSNFNIDPSLNSVSYDENRKGEIDNWRMDNQDQYFTAGFSMSIDCHDLNRDGIDEVIGYGSRDFAVFTIGENLSLNRVAQIRANSKYGYENCHHLLAVTDLDADTTSADSGKWVPEIVHIDFINDPASNINNPGQLRIRAHQPVLDVSGSITSIAYRAELRTDIDGTYIPSCVIAPGDFDGDAVRLGKPRLFSREYVVQPTVILNAPPVHYDIISDTSYDVCFSYNENDPEFVSSYEFTNSADKQVETEVHGDWGISASLSAGGSFLGVGARTTLTTKYGEGFSKSELNRHTMVIEQKAYARVDDEIYATITDYSFWEYPVYFKGEHYGYVLAAIPYFKGNNWFPSKSWTGISHIPNHEVGNILSYPNYANVINNPELEQLLYDFGTCELHGTSENHMALTITEFTFISDQTSWDFGMSINSAVWGWGISLSTEAHYNKGEINTHKTSVSEQFEITIDLFDINTEIGEVNYKVRPYAYRSQNGVIVIDYNVELPVAAPGDPVTWWQNHYSDYADPAFILPWLYDPEKGYTLEEKAKRHLTKEITFNPSTPQAGDTVMIKARIHNYSLMDTDSPVTVRFYQGDPDAGGTAIVSIYGETEVTTPSVIASQDVAYVEMYWAVPIEISEYTRIYAVIDPDNNITEIHENNNKGFVTLSLWGTTSIEEVVPSEIPDQFILYQNYPNPFNPTTTISYQLPKTSNVVISVYNIIGQKIATLVSKKQSAGVYNVEWDASNMASGVYLYRLSVGSLTTKSGHSVAGEAGGYVETKKMVLIR